MKKILATSLMALGIAFWGAVGVTAVTAVVSTPKAEASYLTPKEACDVTGTAFAHGVSFPGGVNAYDRALYVKNIRGNANFNLGLSFQGYQYSQTPDITTCDYMTGSSAGTCAKAGATYCWYDTLGLLEFMSQRWGVQSDYSKHVIWTWLESSVCWVKYPDGSNHYFSC